MSSQPFNRPCSELRRKAEFLRLLGAGGHAEAVEHCVERIEDSWLQWQSQKLTVAEAAEASGYSEPHIRRLLAENRLKNAGSAGRPRIRRADLPRKPRRRSAGEVDLIGEILKAREANG